MGPRALTGATTLRRALLRLEALSGQLPAREESLLSLQADPLGRLRAPVDLAALLAPRLERLETAADDRVPAQDAASARPAARRVSSRRRDVLRPLRPQDAHGLQAAELLAPGPLAAAAPTGDLARHGRKTAGDPGRPFAPTGTAAEERRAAVPPLEPAGPQSPDGPADVGRTVPDGALGRFAARVPGGAAAVATPLAAVTAAPAGPASASRAATAAASASPPSVARPDPSPAGPEAAGAGPLAAARLPEPGRAAATDPEGSPHALRRGREPRSSGLEELVRRWEAGHGAADAGGEASPPEGAPPAAEAESEQALSARLERVLLRELRRSGIEVASG